MLNPLSTPFVGADAPNKELNASCPDGAAAAAGAGFGFEGFVGVGDLKGAELEVAARYSKAERPLVRLGCDAGVANERSTKSSMAEQLLVPEHGVCILYERA
jgi:hypothetical protein